MDQQNYSAPPPPPYPAPLVFPAPPAPPRGWNGKTNGFSIAALSLSLLGCVGPLSVAFGVLGLIQSRRNGDRRGRIYAVLGLGINGLWLIAIVIAMAVNLGKDIGDGPDRDAFGAIRGERSISITDLRAGDCIKDLDSQSGSHIDVLPCSSAHADEVFAVFTLPKGPWAGTAKVREDAQATCEARFEAYAGVQPNEDAYMLFASPPGELDWPEDRTVQCIAHQLKGTTAGSLRR